MLRDLLGFALGSSFGVYMLAIVAAGLRTGRIRHTDSTSSFSLRGQPVQFCLVTLVFVFFAGLSLYLAFTRAFAIWHRLSA